jgi:hypothetical protein
LPPSPLINQLTSPLDQIASSYRRLRRANSNHMPGGTKPSVSMAQS